jgi:regulator of protease activity HflC (stomatin/prohibitin superfamily)
LDAETPLAHAFAWATAASELERTITVPLFFFTVEQQERAIVERFGKFVRVAGPGLQRKTPFVEKVAGRMSLQVEQLNADIETKTKDNVFVVVQLAIQYMVGAEPEKVKDAFYKLDDPEVQMKSYAFDVVRSHIPTMDLDEAYADADTIAKHIQDTLQTQMADYGYAIIKALITNIEPDQRVKDAMNNINAARRNQEAATAQGEGDKTLRIKKAEGESESMRLHGEGVAAEREAIAMGLKKSLAVLADERGIDPKEAMALVALTQYMDTIRSVGEHGNMTTLLLPASPAAVGSLMDEVQQGMLRGNLAAGAAQIGGNGGRRVSPSAPEHALS